MSIFDEMDKIKEDFEGVIEKLHNHDEENMGINIIIDNDTADGDSSRIIFVDIENDAGESICIGAELTTEEGHRKIRISTSDIINHERI